MNLNLIILNIMKTINILKGVVVLIIVMIALPGFSSNDPTDVNSKETKMKRIVSAAVDFPCCLVDESGQTNIVTVDFNVTEDGHVKVNEISGNPTFTSHVKAQLEKLVLKKMSDLVGKSFVYRFVFNK